MLMTLLIFLVLLAFIFLGFPIFMALLTTVDGASAVIETVFENRYMHVPELKKMGATIKTDDRCALVTGNARLKGSKVAKKFAK